MGVKNENCTFEHPAKLVQVDLERNKQPRVEIEIEKMEDKNG